VIILSKTIAIKTRTWEGHRDGSGSQLMQLRLVEMCEGKQKEEEKISLKGFLRE